MNTRSGRFADVSAVVGFDHDADSRGLALVDWDHDGDLDVWTSNRSAPRVRFLENQNASENGFLAIRLEGTASNKDAIGTRLELVTRADATDKEAKYIQTLRAGEGYLAQSSKWLHFGLGSEEPVRLLVRWPNGNTQTFTKLLANSRYKIVEGQSEMERLPERSQVVLAQMDVPKAKASSTLRVVSSRRLPVPQLQLLDEGGQNETVNFNASKYTLLTLWATWCQPCMVELKELEQNRQALSEVRLRWLPVNVDGLDEDVAQRIAQSKKALGNLGVGIENRLATKSAVECLDVVQKSLTSKQDPLPVPCSFLIDGTGKLVVVYKGAVGVEQIVADIAHFEKPVADPRDHAIPFSGSWAMNTFEPDLMAIATSLIQIGRADEALSYMLTHIPNKDFPLPITRESLTEAYLDLGRTFLGRREVDKAQRAALQALKVNPYSDKTRLALGELALIQNRKSEAVKHYREVIRNSPRQPMALNNLAWILATSRDETLRSPGDAITYAESLCSLTNYEEPVSLDTYSVALASDGQFERAIEILNSALKFAKQVGKSTDRMEARLKLFRDGKPYRE